MIFESSGGAEVDDSMLVGLADAIDRALAEQCSSRALHDFFDRKSDLDVQLWNLATALGWFALPLDEEDGGLGLGLEAVHLLYLAIGRHAVPGPFAPTLTAAQWLAVNLGETERRAHISRLLAGELVIAVPAGRTGARLKIEDGKLSGRTSAMLGGPGATHLLVPATEKGAPSWVLVETTGATYAGADLWDRTQALGSWNLDAAPTIAVVPDADGAGERLLTRHLSLAMASESLGGARAIAEQTIDYMKTREQFGRPIGSFQALKHRAVDLILRITLQEKLLVRAIRAIATNHPQADMWAAFAKAGATETFTFVADDCVRLHGGIGYTWESDCHIFLKRARLNEKIGGDNIAARDAAGAMLIGSLSEGRSPAEAFS